MGGLGRISWREACMLPHAGNRSPSSSSIIGSSLSTRLATAPTKASTRSLALVLFVGRAFLDIDEIEHLLRRVTQLGSQMRSSALRFGIKVPFSERCWRLSFVGPASKISPSFGEFRSWLGSGATVQASAPFLLSTSKQTGRPKTSIGSFPSGCSHGIWLIRQ
jgi:hypothetical protein